MSYVYFKVLALEPKQFIRVHVHILLPCCLLCFINNNNYGIQLLFEIYKTLDSRSQEDGLFYGFAEYKVK